MSATPLLQALAQAGALRTLDHALARTLQRLDPATSDAVLAAAALAARAPAEGDAAFNPARPPALPDTLALPDAATWRAQLAGSRWVDVPPDALAPSRSDAPLVLEHGLLYLRRYREHERRLAGGLRRMAAHTPPAGDLAPLAPLFDQLFPHARQGDDRQARAAAVALCHAVLLVTGGPGTGKTTTIARLLVLLAAQAAQAGRAAPRIALAAPTGRAAERMGESLRQAVDTLRAAGIDPTLLDALPTRGSTLHRLLGTVPDSPRVRFDAGNPLPVDVVVVDEASMVDLPLMARLVDAVPAGARLVLLGDPDQLPSVEAGDVLAGIVAAIGDGATLTDADTAALAPLLGLPRGPAPGPQADLFAPTPVHAAGTPASAATPGRRVHLVRGYRQAAALDLAPLADAVRAGEATTTLSLLRGGALSGVHFHEHTGDPLAIGDGLLLAHWQALAQCADPADALARAGTLRLLTAVRDGAQGARGLNARIEALLAGPARRAGAHFHGRLLLVTENSPRHRLSNGDTGICLRQADGTVVAWFPGDGTGGPRAFHPAALPLHDSAFAMTVHKAQGSEADTVVLQLPLHDARVLSRELVYTGITRARHALHVCASAPVLATALGRHAERVSGLALRLAAR